MDDETCDEILREIELVDFRSRGETITLNSEVTGWQLNRIKKEEREAKKRKLSVETIRQADEKGAEYFANFHKPKVRKFWLEQLKKWSAVERGLQILAERLKKGTPLPADVEEQVGVRFQYSRLSAPQVRQLKWKIVAQLLWLENPGVSAQTIVDKMVRDPDLFDLLNPESLSSFDNRESRFRAIEDVVRSVNPRGKGKRGRYSKVKLGPSEIIPIQEVCCDLFNKKICAQGLYILVTTLFSIQMNRKNYAKFTDHPLLAFYTDCNPLLARCAEEVWVMEQF